jgi:hypothetical protein
MIVLKTSNNSNPLNQFEFAFDFFMLYFSPCNSICTILFKLRNNPPGQWDDESHASPHLISFFFITCFPKKRVPGLF